MTEPNSYLPQDSPNLEFVYNNESELKPTYWPLFWSEYEVSEQANQLYNDYDDDYITYSGDSWKSLMVSKEKDGRYKNFTLRAYSGDSFNFYLSAGSLVDGVETYYSGPLTTSGNYSVLTSYSGQSTAEANAVSFTAPGDNTTVYTFPQVSTINFVKLYHQATASGEEYRLYQFLPRTLIQVDDLEADVISAVTVRVQDTLVVGPNMIGDKTILGQKIVDGTLSGILLTDGTITGSKIQANTISGALITAGTITSNLIAVSGIDADRINVTTLSALATNTGSLDVTGSIVVSGVNSQIDAGYTKITQSGISIGNTFTELDNTNALKIYGLIPSGGGNVIGMAIYNNLNPDTPHAIFQTDFDNAVEIENLAIDGVTNINIPQGPIENAFNVWVYTGIPVDEFTSVPQFSVGDYYTDIRNDLRIWGWGNLLSPEVSVDALGLSTNAIQVNGLAQFYNRADFSGSGIILDNSSLVVKNSNGTPVTTLYNTGGTETSGTALASTHRASQFGSSTTPSFSWGSDTGTGFFRYGAGAIGVAGSTILSAVFVGSQLQVSDGAQSVPGLSFINDQDTGFYRAEDNVIRISTGNNFTGLFSTNQIQMASGTEALPSYTFVNDNDTGMYRSSTNAVALTAGGNQILIAAAAGQVLISTTNSNGQLTVEVPNGTARTITTWRQLNDASAYINFVCNTVSASTPVQTSALGAYAGKVRVLINGSVRWIPFYL